MSILKGRLLNGKPWSIQGGTAVTPVLTAGGVPPPPPSGTTGIIAAPSSATVGTAALLAVLVSGSGTLYASLSSGGAEQGSRVAVTSASATVSLTPTAAAATTANLYAAATGGAPVATSASFTPAAAAAPGTAPPGPPPAPTGTAPGPITDITFTQLFPLSVGMNFASINDRIPFGTFVPVGGVGPFTYSVDSNAWGFTQYDPNYVPDQRVGRVEPGYGAFPSSGVSITLRVVDGVGSTFTKTVAIDTSGPATTLEIGGPYSWPNNQPAPSNCSNPLALMGSGHSTGTDTISVSCPTSNAWAWQYGALSLTSMPPPGVYAVTVTATGSGGTLTKTVNFTITSGAINGAFFQPKVASTSTPAGYLVGTLAVSTPYNTRTYNLTDTAGGKYAIDSFGNIRVRSQLSLGTDHVTVAVSDGPLTTSIVLAIPVYQGTVVPATNMSMAVATNLTNYVPNWNNTVRPVGTPTVTGIPGTKAWSLTQTRSCFFNESQLPYARGHARYIIDPVTGAVSAKAQLSATAGETLTVTCSDGINTCTQTFPVSVAAVVGPTLYVGRGMAALHGAGVGFDHMRDLIPLFQNDGHDLGALAGATVLIAWDSDPNYYANDCNNQYDTQNGGTPAIYTSRYSLCGPITFRGVLGPQGQFPRLGGVVDSAAGGCANNNKATICIGEGDALIENLEISFVHGGGFAGDQLPASGVSGLRQDGSAGCDFTVRNCYIHDCDNGIQTGQSEGIITLHNVEIANGSASSTGGGLNHNIYIGEAWKVVVDNLLSWNTMTGHLFKSRAGQGTITNSRFLSSERGSPSNLLNIPQGGTWLVDNCVLQQGAQPSNPYALEYLEDQNYISEWPDYVHHLTVQNCTFINLAANPGEPVTAIMAVGTKSQSRGDYSTAQSINNSFYNYSDAQRAKGVGGYVGATSGFSGFVPADDTHDFSVVVSGSVTLAIPPPLSFATPTTLVHSRPSWHLNSVDGNGRLHFPGMVGAQIDPGVDEIRIPASSPAGTVVFSPTAYGSPNYANSGAAQPDPHINPFTAGTVWSLGTNLADYYGFPFGLAQSHYNVDPSTGVVTVASGGLGGTGHDLMSVRAVGPAPISKVAEWIFFVVKT